MATISATIIIIVAAIAMNIAGVAGWKKLSLRFGQIYLGVLSPTNENERQARPDCCFRSTLDQTSTLDRT